MKKIFIPLVLLTLLFLSSCSNIGEGYQEYMENVSCDDNPSLNDNQKKVCKAQVAGSVGTGQKSADDILSQYLPERKNNTGAGLTINKWLWQGSIETVREFPLKIADAFGGVIETEWVTDTKDPKKRCSIKILISSREFVANGMKANLICQKLDGSSWLLMENDFADENEKIENAILEKARKSYLKFSS